MLPACAQAGAGCAGSEGGFGGWREVGHVKRVGFGDEPA